MRVFLRACYFALGLGLAVNSAAGTDLVVYTEDYPPYNFPDENGEVAGRSAEGVRKILDAAGLSYEIKLVPWARAITGVQSSETALIFSIVRIPSREENFTWLAPLAPSDFFLFARKDDTREFTLKGVREGRYSGACFHTDVTCELMRIAGFPAHKIHPVIDRDTGDFLLVNAGRADLFATEILVNNRLRARDGYPADAAKPVLQIAPSADFYLAGGKSLDAGVKAVILDAYRKLVESGQYDHNEFSSVRD